MKKINCQKHGLYRFEDFTDFNQFNLWQRYVKKIRAIGVIQLNP